MKLLVFPLSTYVISILVKSISIENLFFYESILFDFNSFPIFLKENIELDLKLMDYCELIHAVMHSLNMSLFCEKSRLSCFGGSLRSFRWTMLKRYLSTYYDTMINCVKCVVASELERIHGKDTYIVYYSMIIYQLMIRFNESFLSWWTTYILSLWAEEKGNKRIVTS